MTRNKDSRLILKHLARNLELDTEHGAQVHQKTDPDQQRPWQSSHSSTKPHKGVHPNGKKPGQTAGSLRGLAQRGADGPLTTESSQLTIY